MAFRDEVEALVQGQPGFVCADCLADKLGASRRQVTMAMIGLRATERFDVVEATCHACHAHRRVIRGASG